MNGVEFVVLITIIITQSSEGSQPKKGPGISSCSYYGYLSDDCSKPHLMPIDIIPEECTSLFWDGLIVDENFNVTYAYNYGDDKGVLDLLLKNGKPVYVFFGMDTQEIWAQILGCDGSDGLTAAYKDMEGLKTYMEAHPGIVGLVLKQLEFDKNSIECTGYTKRLATYIGVIRNKFPDLEIGMELYGISLLDYYAAPTMAWLDFSVLDSYLDYYIVDVHDFNDCSSEFISSGTAPVDGNAPYTLTKIQECLNIINVPKNKTYYNIGLYATSDYLFSLSCQRTYQEICTNQKETDNLCADTTQTFFEKGKFLKQSEVGFVGTYIDFADPYDKCGCNRPFEPFYDVLDGLYGSPAPESCTSIDDRV